MRVAAFSIEAVSARRILNHIGEPAERLVDAVPDWDTLAQPQPEYIFDQRVQW